MAERERHSERVEMDPSKQQPGVCSLHPWQKKKNERRGGLGYRWPRCRCHGPDACAVAKRETCTRDQTFFSAAAVFRARHGFVAGRTHARGGRLWRIVGKEHHLDLRGRN